MAVLYITEYATVAIMQAGRVVQAPMEPPLAEQTVAIGGSSASSAAFNTKTTFVELHCDAICSVSFGTAPTASATNRRMAANQTTDRGVPMGAGFKVAVITNS
jgi:hypothetical protein